MKPYYDDGQVTIYHGDCREVVAQLDTSDAVFVTDPPYGVGKDYGDGLTDDLATCVPLWQWLIDQARPTCFTFSHTRLFDLPVRPQWIGAWVKNRDPLDHGSGRLARVTETISSLDAERMRLVLVRVVEGRDPDITIQMSEGIVARIPMFVIRSLLADFDSVQPEQTGR